MDTNASFDTLSTKLDWATQELTQREHEELKAWYVDNHRTSVHSVENDDPANNLNRFFSFWLDERPDAVKNYRRVIEQSIATPLVPAAALGLLWLHWYAVLPSRAGVIYEIKASRSWGVTRAQVLETLAYGFIHGGPHALSIAMDGCEDYLNAWNDERSEDDVDWPEGWHHDVSPLHIGIDLSSPGMTAAEADAYRRWHLENEGEVPKYVDFLIEHNPDGLKAFRQRFESVFRGDLPVQMEPLMRMGLAGMRGRSGTMRRAAHFARVLGVDQDLINHTGSYLQFFLGDGLMDKAIAGLAR